MSHLNDCRRVHFCLEADDEVSFCERPSEEDRRRQQSTAATSHGIGNENNNYESAHAIEQTHLNMTTEVEDLLQYLNRFTFPPTSSGKKCARETYNDDNVTHFTSPARISLGLEESLSPDPGKAVERSPMLKAVSSDREYLSETNHSVKANLEPALEVLNELRLDRIDVLATGDTNDLLIARATDVKSSTLSLDEGLNPAAISIASVDELYKQAQAERAAARQWATNLRKAVYEWVQQYRSLVESYHHQHNKQETISEQYYTAALRHQQEQVQRDQFEHRKAVLSLHKIICDQQKRLINLEKNVAMTALLRDEKKGIEKHKADPTHITLENESFEKRIRRVANPANLRAVSPPHLSDDRISFLDGLLIDDVPKYTATTTVKISPTSVISTSSSNRSRRCIHCTEDGRCDVIMYGNGSVREIYKKVNDDNNVLQEVIRFPNGDVQTTTENDKAYYFAASGVIQVVRNDALTGVVEYHFPNGQVEEHRTNGKKVVLFPDGTVQQYNADGSLLAFDNAASNRSLSHVYEEEGHSFACTV